MRKFRNAAIIALILSLIIAIFIWKSHIIDKAKSGCHLSDTALIQRYLRQAEKKKSYAPDSSIILFKEVVKLIPKNSKNTEELHFLVMAYIGMASNYSNTGNYDEAGRNDSIAYSVASGINDKEVLAMSVNLKGILRYNVGEFKEAIKYYSQALQLAEESGNQVLMSKINTNIGVAEFLLGNRKEALKGFNGALQCAQKLKNDDLLSASYLNIGLVQFNWGNYNEASKGYIQALGIYEKMGDKQGQLLCFQNLGNIYFSLGDYSLTIESQKKALKLSKQVNDRKGIAKAHQNLGETFFHLGDNKAAIKEFILSIKSKEALDDKEGTGITLASLGSLHFHQKDYAKAAYYYNKALEINKTIDLKAQMAQNYANLADVFSAKGLSDSAIAYYGKSQGINRELDNKSGLSDIALRLGSIYRIRKEYSKAKSYLLGALSSKKELGEKVSMASACTELAFLYLDMADGKKISENEAYNQAIVYGLKSYSIAEQVKEISAKISACDVLKHAYSAKGQTGNALRYANEMMAARDSLFDKSKAEATIYAEAIWNTEKKQRQIENLENSRKISKGIIEKKELETKRQKILIFAISLILMVTIGLAIAIVLYIRKRRDMQYQKQLTNIAMLKMTNIRNRMSPHFFFNALSGIAGSVTEPELKSKFSNLSILLRKTVENIEQTVISLEEEMSTVKAFVELQHEHIPKPFEANFDIDTKVEIKHLLPAMIIQIPVENAIKHGLMLQTSESRKLNVNITAVDKGLHIEIKDNGIGLEASAGRTTGTGTGLKVLLQTIYLLNSKNHEKITFDIVDLYKQEPRENGTKVVIFIPGNYSYNL